ncbi:MAG: 50S ribosomal protein L23 [Actinomycetota bacterium]
MKNPRDVIIKPVISEKSYKLIETNKYVFVVDPEASKEEIKEAVRNIFNVRVTGVNTISHKGKPKRQGFTAGRRAGFKKAIVTLAEGERIEFFETK